LLIFSRYKIARVDQKETALGKEMREKGAKPGKEEKVIRRELACVLTGGTLVDESMLQDEMATYCVAIKVCQSKYFGAKQLFKVICYRNLLLRGTHHLGSLLSIQQLESSP
jgi:DNA mismatch repair ATPase MutS